MCRKAENEAREERNKPMAARYGSDYARFRAVGLTHEEAIAKIQERQESAKKHAEWKRQQENESEAKTYWLVTCWGEPSGQGDAGTGLYSKQEHAENHARWLIDYRGWDEKLIEIEERQMTKEEQEQRMIAVRQRRIDWDNAVFTGPRGGRYRINSNGRKSYDVP